MATTNPNFELEVYLHHGLEMSHARDFHCDVAEHYQDHSEERRMLVHCTEPFCDENLIVFFARTCEH